MAETGLPFREVKRYPDGTERAFTCSLMAYDGHVAVARFVSERDIEWHDYTFPTAGYTLAWYWRERRYLLYRMHTPDGSPIVDRFDVVDGLRLGRDGVEYRDLYLDVWIDREGVARLDDEDELAAGAAAGLLRPVEIAAARRTARLLLRRHAGIIVAAERWLEDALRARR